MRLNQFKSQMPSFKEPQVTKIRRRDSRCSKILTGQITSEYLSGETFFSLLSSCLYTPLCHPILSSNRIHHYGTLRLAEDRMRYVGWKRDIVFSVNKKKFGYNNANEFLNVVLLLFAEPRKMKSTEKRNVNSRRIGFAIRSGQRSCLFLSLSPLSSVLLKLRVFQMTNEQSALYRADTLLHG